MLIENKDLENRLIKLKNEIFTTLREQSDRKGLVNISDSISINPGLLTLGKPSIVGPYLFNTVFLQTPIVTFGQVNHVQTKDTVGNDISDQSNLFLVVPYIANWSWNQGSVDGFFLGLYALLEPPVNVKKHTIMWQAQGKAAQNKNHHLRSAWTHSYDNNVSTHLVQSDLDVGKQ